MKKICLQMGHVNAQHHTISGLKGNTGAPGEAELTKRITDRVASMLRERGFEVKQTDAVAYNDTSVTKVDWDLFLSIHGEADVHNKDGGFVDFPEPSTDGATKESQRICAAIESTYFKETQIVNRPEWRNANTKYYYMWKYLSAKTPCNLIELGVVQNAHDKVLLGNTELIAPALVRGICKAFNVSYDITPPPAPEPIDPKDKKIEELEKSVKELKTALETKEKTHDDKVALFKTECQALLNGLQEKILQL